MSAVEITKDNFEQEVLKSTEPVLLDFWASWCVPCGMMSPVVEEVAEEKANVKVGKVNVDDEPALAATFGIDSIPTLIVLKDGKAVKKSIGVVSKTEVLSLFDA